MLAKLNLAATAPSPIPTWRAAYSDRTALLMAWFCGLAYMPFGSGCAYSAADPNPLLTKALSGAGFKLAATFNEGSCNAFLATGPDFNVLAFRGTQTGKDWETDLTAAPDKLILPHHRDHVWVHRGFLEAFKGQRTEILKAVDGLPPNVGLYITGHSLGGAMAQIASAFLERDTLAACYTYGAPRTGQALFDAIVKCPHYRIVHKMDLVPATPPPEYNGYVHSGDPRLILDGVDFALRRSRDPLAEAVAILLALPNFLLTHKVTVIDDHAIDRYHAILDRIARARSGSLGKTAQRKISAWPTTGRVLMASSIVALVALAVVARTHAPLASHRAQML